MTPDPILYDTAEPEENAEESGYSPLWWLVVLILSALFWAALIGGGVLIASML